MLPIEKDINAPSGKVQVHKLEPAQKTYFFQRPTGEIFAAHAHEAWQLLQKVTAYSKELKFIGSSSGQKFVQAVSESHRVFKETGDFSKAQEIIRQGERDEIEAARGNMEYPQDPSRVEFKRQP